MVAIPRPEFWSVPSLVAPEQTLARQIGMIPGLWVLDLQTQEGAYFLPRPHDAIHQLQKHKIWVCPLYEPFLEWLFNQDLSQPLPPLLELPEAPSAIYGYRRNGAD